MEQKELLCQRLNGVSRLLYAIEESSIGVAAKSDYLQARSKKAATRKRQFVQAGVACLIGLLLMGAMFLLNFFLFSPEGYRAIFVFSGWQGIAVSIAAILGIVIAVISLLFPLPIRAIQKRRAKKAEGKVANNMALWHDKIVKAYQSMGDAVMDSEMLFPGEFHPQARHVDFVLKAFNSGKFDNLRDMLNYYNAMLVKENSNPNLKKVVYSSREDLRKIVASAGM